MSQVVLDQPRVCALVGQGEAARMAQHVRVRIHEQTTSRHCLHQCGFKPIVLNRLSALISTLGLPASGGLILPLRGLVARRDDTYRVQSI